MTATLDRSGHHARRLTGLSSWGTGTQAPSLLAKIYGVYEIAIRNTATGKTFKQDVLVMENLFYNRKITKATSSTAHDGESEKEANSLPWLCAWRIAQIFDLKGSVRSRYARTTGGETDVLLDENLLEGTTMTLNRWRARGRGLTHSEWGVGLPALHTNPLYVHLHSKQALMNAVQNDTLFLNDLNVIDYSLLVGIQANSGELVVGLVGTSRHRKRVSENVTNNSERSKTNQIISGRTLGTKSWRAG